MKENVEVRPSVD